MRTLFLPAAALLAVVATHAMAQTAASNITAADTHSEIAPALPSPALGADAGPREYLRAARASLSTGQTGAAQQALEMAETRALDRSVAQDRAKDPSASPMVAEIRDALKALGDGDRHHAMDLIDQALAG
jgi:hypothetical protein